MTTIAAGRTRVIVMPLPQCKQHAFAGWAMRAVTEPDSREIFRSERIIPQFGRQVSPLRDDAYPRSAGSSLRFDDFQSITRPVIGRFARAKRARL
jgi:hypothetical protein